MLWIFELWGRSLDLTYFKWTSFIINWWLFKIKMTDLDKSDHLLKFTTSGLRDFSCLLNQLKLKPKHKYFVNSFTGTYTKLVIWLAIWQDWCFGQYSIVSSLKLEVFTNVVNYFSLQILSFVQSSSHFFLKSLQFHVSYWVTWCLSDNSII